MKMTNKEKADCLLELHKTQLDHFLQTRDIEIKVNLALWALIAASGSFMYGKVHLISWHSWLVYTIFTLAIFLGHMYLWMIPIGRSESTDDHFINQYRNAVESLIEVQIMKLEKRKRPISLQRWILAESGITLVLLVAVGILLSLG